MFSMERRGGKPPGTFGNVRAAQELVAMRVVLIMAFATAIAATGSSCSPDYRACNVLCDVGLGCPNGYTCGTDLFCYESPEQAATLACSVAGTDGSLGEPGGDAGSSTIDTCTDDTEPNNIQAVPLEVPPATEASRQDISLDVGDIDSYAFTLVQSRSVTVQVTVVRDTLGFFGIVDSTGVRAQGARDAPGHFVASKLLSPGDYVVQVSAGSVENCYDLSLQLGD
jgi:hypothetical protein